ncbi:MAG: MlaC/ttg2D family ABC transporter substrate-binding protein [Woeseiaceae bacterium]
MNGIRISIAAIGLLLAPLLTSAATPDEFIVEAVDVLGEKMSGRRSELAGDSEALYALIDEVLLPRFDRRLAAQQVLAKHWRTASDEQRARFIDAFYTTLVQRYADGVLDFEHDRVKVLPFRGDVSKRTAVVKTRVDLEDGTNVSVNYTLVNKKPGWMMFDVMIEGVSYVRNFRAEFDSEIRASSLEDVISRLEQEAVGVSDVETENAGESSE